MLATVAVLHGNRHGRTRAACETANYINLLVFCPLIKLEEGFILAKTKQKDNRFKVLNEIPKDVLSGTVGGMHPDTKKIIEQIKKARGKVLACKFKNASEAKNRMQALRRAKSKGYVNYKEARRKGNVVYFRLR